MYRTRFVSRLKNITAVSNEEAADIGSFLYHASGLLLNRFILKAAFGFVNVFTPIILYQKFGLSMIGVYILLHLVVILATPVSARLLATVGVRPLIAASVPFSALSIAILGLNGVPDAVQGLLLRCVSASAQHCTGCPTM
jgi:hypothetical protein